MNLGDHIEEIGTGDYDQAARIAIKLDPEGFLRWIVPEFPPQLVFTRWLDTRTIPFPGEHVSICDQRGDRKPD